MSYVDSVLEPGEQVIYRTTVSWTVFTTAIWLGLAALVVLIAGANFTGTGIETFALAVALILAVLAVAAFIRAWILRATTEIAVTDRRVIVKRGLVRRYTIEMNMQKVESVDVEQTLLGRIFNYGNVTVRGTGSTFNTIRQIDAPLKLRSTITAR